MANYHSGKKRLFNVNWSVFHSDISAWQTLSVEAKRLLVEKVEAAVYTRPAALNQEYPAIQHSGFVDVSPSGLGVKYKKETWPIFRVFRELVGFYDRAIRDKHERVLYLDRFFNWNQIDSFSGASYHRIYSEQLVGMVSSYDWISEFLKKDEGLHWEVSLTLPDEKRFFQSATVFQNTQQLIRILLSHDGQVPFADLPALVGKPAEQLAESINAGLRYLLFYISVDPQTYDPYLFLWPELVHRLNRPQARIPKPIQPSGPIFEMPYRLYDMSTVLTECILEPFRVRSNESIIYEKTRKYLDTKVVPIEDWIGEYRPNQKEGRIHQAINAAYHMSLLALKDIQGNHSQFEITPQGREWSQLPPKVQLKKIFTTFRPHQIIQSESGWYAASYGYTDGALMDKKYEIFRDALKSSFSLLREEGFYSLTDFADYVARENNPLFELRAKKSHLLGLVFYRYGMINLSELEELWEQIIKSYLFDNLLPYGGIKIGRDATGEIFFSLTSIGRYLLGFHTEFDLAEDKPQVVVQPNFDVVFLAPSPQTETVFNRFAERVGNGLGTLFQITKKSIQRAAGAGISAEDILQDLESIGSRKLPQNVRHEIFEWHQSHRRAVAVPVILVTCPDDTTAAKVASKAGKEAKFITDTIVTLPLKAVNDKLIQKLRETGVFLDYTPPDLSVKKKKRY